MGETEENSRSEVPIHAAVKVMLASEDIFFGPGVYQIMKEIDASGSVSEASRITGISYSKAWKILKKCERRLGYQVVSRRAGGSGGGQAALTEKGKELIRLYEIFDRRVHEKAAALYKEIFIDHNTDGKEKSEI